MLVVGLVLTGALAWSSASIHARNEDRLLNLQLRQAASVVSAAIPTIQIPLTSAAALAEATGGDAHQFHQYMASFVTGSGPFASAELWRVSESESTLVAAEGAASEIPPPTPAQRTFLASAQRSRVLAVKSSLNQARPHIDYASSIAGSPWVVYAEANLPKGRKLKVTRNSAFSQLNYVIYLGHSTAAADIIGASVGPLPPGGDQAKVSVPFGDNAITLVAAPNQELGGSLLARLWWIVAVVGTVLSAAAALMTGFLVRRRRQAERLARENRRMYSEQRSIAEVLQHALLPAVIPPFPGVETAVRYVTGRTGTDVGGDWYDVIPLDANSFVFVLGDVSGRGVEAATIMARLHFAIRAYAVQGDSPATILDKLGLLLDLERDASFATVLCGLVDVAAHSITLVNAGHPPLLVLNGSAGHFVTTPVGPPVGVRATTRYRAETIEVPRGATVLAFTDGLIERRGEIIDAGLERLRDLTVERPTNLDGLLTKVLTESMESGYDDDTAILAVRWTS